MTRRPHVSETAAHASHEAAEVVREKMNLVKPKLRGWLHAATSPLSLAAAVVLIVLSPTLETRVGSALFAGSALLLFTVSGIYHRGNWSKRTWEVLRRFDHANIFLLIAGSYTPITVLALPPKKAIVLICLVWGGALLGIAFRVFWIGAPRWLYVPLYLLLGYAAFAFIVDFFNANAAMIILILVGGLFYTLGAVAYGFKRPNPIPGVFGFHEIFHAFTLLAFLCHWTGILLIALHPVYG